MGGVGCFVFTGNGISTTSEVFQLQSLYERRVKLYRMEFPEAKRLQLIYQCLYVFVYANIVVEYWWIFCWSFYSQLATDILYFLFNGYWLCLNDNMFNFKEILRNCKEEGCTTFILQCRVYGLLSSYDLYTVCTL